MSTYALVTKSPAGPVAAAVRAGRVGGFVAADPRGAIVLFDPPATADATMRHLVRPAVELVRRTASPAWLLLGDSRRAEAVAIGRTGPLSLSWTAGRRPPENPAEYLANRQAWDARCAEVAEGYGLPMLGPRLAMLRNEPPIPLDDLLRWVCAIVGLPEAAVGRSLLDAATPGLPGARRVDAAAPAGVWQRLFARA
jgi:hypothetical protein